MWLLFEFYLSTDIDNIMTGYRKRIKEMKEAGLLEPKNISAEMKGEWL